MYSMKKYLLLFLCLTLGVAYATDHSTGAGNDL